MNTKQILTVTTTLSLAFLSGYASAHDATWKDRVGSNSLSSAPRGADSPDMVKTPPTGYPDTSMSTVDTGGNGMARRDRFDIYGKGNGEEIEFKSMPRHTHHAKRDWKGEDTTTFAAPVTEHYYAVYGEDIPALRGLQLETAINRLHHINREEIELSKMAETRGKSPEFLNLAHQIRADHELLEKKVNALAKRRGLRLESYQLATYEKAVRDRLNKLKGTEFETSFLRVNEQNQVESSRSLRLVRNDLTDTEVRGLINETLPRMTAERILPSDKARARAEEGDLGE
jgi:predicted outer membrane protein